MKYPPGSRFNRSARQRFLDIASAIFILGLIAYVAYLACDTIRPFPANKQAAVPQESI